MIDLSNEVEYPLEQCATCVHGRVCRWIDVVSELQDVTPINFTNADCCEYDDKTQPMNVQDDEEVVESLYSKITTAVERYMVQTGNQPSILTMNKSTRDMLKDEVLGKIAGMDSEELEENDISYIMLYGATLYLRTNNAMPDGEFLISGAKSEEDYDE